MMEEVSISVAYDAHIIDQMSEEEILASLVVESLPKQVVSSATLDLTFVTCWFKDAGIFKGVAQQLSLFKNKQTNIRAFVIIYC